jgi:hypothetical protein
MSRRCGFVSGARECFGEARVDKARILGHAGVGVTGDIYRHVYSAELHETARRFAPLNRLPLILLAERT